MTNQSPLHRAQYDSAGNIILTDGNLTQEMSTGSGSLVKKTEGKKVIHSEKKPIWKVTEQDSKKEQTPIKPDIAMKKAEKECDGLLKSAMKEGKVQMLETKKGISTNMKQATTSLGSLPKRSRGLMQSFWRSATVPISLPGSKRKKKRSKLELFVIDTVKFGGTFAAIFVTLFSIINYESFLQIAAAELAIGNDLETQEALEVMGKNTSTIAGKTESSAFARQGSLVAYLPAVGPFEDRLVIPKIGKNLPVVRPSMDGLMRGDWPKFEDDIQAALYDGVVHYPGSARPGQAGNFFMTAHSAHYFWSKSEYKDAFARLHELELGDTYFVFYGGDKHVYKIIEKKEVKPTDVSVLDQPTDKLLSTLMTCTPVGTTLRRLILRAVEIDPSTGLALNVGEKTERVETAHFKNIEALPI